MKRLTATICLILALALVSGCGLFRQPPPSIGSLTVTDRVDEHSRTAIRPLSSFPSGTTQFFAAAQVRNPARGTRVEARWFLDNKLIDEAGVTFALTGERYVAFELASAKPGTPFPAGNYRVQIVVDGNMVQEASFTVQ